MVSQKGGEMAVKGERTSEEQRIRELERELEITRQEGDSLAESRLHLLATKADRFQFIAAHRAEFPVSRMCSVLRVSRSGYYVWRKRSAS